MANPLSQQPGPLTNLLVGCARGYRKERNRIIRIANRKKWDHWQLNEKLTDLQANFQNDFTERLKAYCPNSFTCIDLARLAMKFCVDFEEP